MSNIERQEEELQRYRERGGAIMKTVQRNKIRFRKAPKEQ